MCFKRASILVFFLVFYAIEGKTKSLSGLKANAGVVLSETNITDLSALLNLGKNYAIKKGQILLCVNLKEENEIKIEYYRSWFYPNKVGGYRVFDKDNYKTECVPTKHKIEGLLLGVDKSQLVSLYGSTFEEAVHETEASKKSHLYGLKYMRYATPVKLKNEKLIEGNEEVYLEVESSLATIFTFGSNGKVISYTVKHHVEPTN